MTWAVKSLGVAIFTLFLALPIQAGGKLDGSAGITQIPENGIMMSAGEARYIDEATNLPIFSVPVSGLHQILNEAKATVLIEKEYDVLGEYQGNVRSAPDVGECYKGRVFATADVMIIFSQPREEWYSNELCAESPQDPGGGGGGEEPPLNPDPTCECDPELGCSCSPILIDLQGNGYHLSSAENPVLFDIDAVGMPYRISWTALGADDAFLALDRNGNSVIDDGSELFGNATPQPASADPNGFRALAVYDRAEHGGNDDGTISAADSIFPRLLLWTDGNRDGQSQPWELAALNGSGVRSLDLGYHDGRRRDRYGNWFRWASTMEIDGRRRPVVDAIFVSR